MSGLSRSAPALLALAAAGVWLLGASAADAPAPPPELPAARHAAPPDPVAAAAQPPAAMSTERAPSLAGTDWDGDWSLDARGLPQPRRALRQRFDHLLTQLGERPLPALRAQLAERLVADAVPAAGQQAVLRLFDAYVAVNQHPYRVKVHPREPHTWRAGLAERQTVRRQHLGWDWAEAFYADDDAALLATLAAVETGAPATDTAPEPARHPQAAAREAALEAEWREWERRLAAAKAQWQRLQAAEAMSAPQREAAWARYVQANFEASERVRVEALVLSP